MGSERKEWVREEILGRTTKTEGLLRDRMRSGHSRTFQKHKHIQRRSKRNCKEQGRQKPN